MDERHNSSRSNNFGTHPSHSSPPPTGRSSSGSLPQSFRGEQLPTPTGYRPRYIPQQFLGHPDPTLNEFLRESAAVPTSTAGTNVGPRTTQRAGHSYNRGQQESYNPVHSEPDLSSLPARRKRGASITETGRRRPNFTMTDNPIAPPRGSAANPIDLTTPERPVPRPSFGGEQRQNSYVLPPWQPDADVAHCPVCKTPFSFWYRKHHCRKCGRVVCANCSPHRITIPRQYVVQPPTPAGVSGLSTLTGSSPAAAVSRHLDNAIGNGGAGSLQTGTWQPPGSPGDSEIVRVCNPCVPDPNLSPPPQLPAYEAAPRPASGFAQQNQPYSRPYLQQESAPPLPRYGSMVPSRRSNTQQTHMRAQSNSYTTLPSQADGSRPPQPQFQHLPSRPHRASIAGQPSASRTGTSLPSGPVSLHRYRHSGIIAHPHFPTRPGAPQPDTGPQISQAQRLPPREIAEEDECPVCGRELPAKGPNGEETPRVQHVENCIRQYSAPSAPAPEPTPQSGPSNPSTAARGSILIPGPTEASSSTGEAAPRRATGNRMLVYKASEKDCLGEDGEQQECVICFEEFEEGVEMGRLECLCKFHRICIRQWWETKGVGSCPTHQLHE